MKKLISNITPDFVFPTARKIYYLLNKYKFKGDKIHCPVCEGSFKKFLPGVDNIRQNVKCPGCGTLDRHRLLWLYLINKKSIHKLKIQMLDIAPDQAIQSKLKSLGNINYSSIDLKSPFAMRKMNITNLEYPSEYFDAAICYHVLEHIEDDMKAMKEIYRVLRHGGWAILQSPVNTDQEFTYEDFTIKDSRDRLKAFGREDHVRVYGLDYSNRLSAAGFKVTKDNYVKSFEDAKILKLGLDKEETIYFCEKEKEGN